MVTCAICSQPHVTCGPAGVTIPVAFDHAPTREPYTMADLKEYRYTVNGVSTTGMLNEQDAKALGAELVTAATDTPEVKARPAVDNAARVAPHNKGR